MSILLTRDLFTRETTVSAKSFRSDIRCAFERKSQNQVKSHLIWTQRERKHKVNRCELTCGLADGHSESSFSLMLRNFRQKTQTQKPNSHANIWQNRRNTPNHQKHAPAGELTAFDDGSDGGKRPLAGKAREKQALNVFFHCFNNSRPVFPALFQRHDWKYMSQLHNTHTTPKPPQTDFYQTHTQWTNTCRGAKKCATNLLCY